MADRKRIPKTVENAVREECAQACANPKCREWSTATHELHHIDSDPSNSILKNLILLCGSCHNKVEGGICSEADVILWKRMAESDFLPPPKGQVSPGPTVAIHTNQGIAGHSVHIERVIIKRTKKNKNEPLPGTIGADPDMRTYATYLVGKYIECRKLGQKYDRRSFSPGSAHGILGEGFGSPSSVMHISESRFLDWVAHAQAKIDNTAWGRINKNRKYHSWEEHLSERHG